MMKAETCLNLCEIAEFKCIDLVIAAVKEKIAFTRVYIGSCFCDELFLKTNYSQLLAFLKDTTDVSKITLVVPVFCQKNLEKGKALLNAMLHQYRDMIDEVTLNDYGMLFSDSIRNDSSNHIKINMGRLFFKDYREPRYEEYFQTEWRPKFFTNSLKELIREQNIHEIEIDVTHKSINLSEHPDCTLGIHTPYTYMTTGKICEYASEFQKVQKKFRPNIDCGRECLRAVIEYGMEDNRKWYRLGRTVYFENNCIRLSHSHENHETDEKTKIRMIYFPLNELVKEMAFSES